MSKSGNYNMSEIEKRDAIIQEMAALLEECKEHIAGEVDVVDGDYGVPAPNKAMQLTTEIDNVLFNVT